MDTITALPEKQVRALLQQALDHLGRNDLVQSEAALNVLLADMPEEPDALQLMGIIRRQQGLPLDAEALYRRSLAVKPEQPNVRHNLGNMLRLEGRLDEAIAEQTEAIRLKPNYAEAFLDLGLAQSAKGDFAAAEKSFRASLRVQPNYVFAKQALAATLNDLNRPKEAETLLLQTLMLGSRDQRQVAALEHNLGVALKLQHRYAEALRLFDTAQSKVPDMPAVDYNRGNTLQHLGRLEEAAFCYRRALGRNPLDMRAHRDLNHLLYRLGRDDEFLKSYDEVMALYPDFGGLPLDKANFLFLKEDFGGAREYFERAARMLPDHVMPHDGLGMILARQGEFEGAIREHEIALKMEPQNAHAWRNYAETLIRAGDAKKALSAAEEARAIEPEDQGALAIWSIAANLLDDPRGEILNDYENFVQMFELEPPQGYSDMESFNRDLNAYLDRLHRDKREMIDQTLRGGTQTLEDIFGRGHDPVERLRARIDEAVAVYISRMKEDSEHPLLKRRRRDFGYAASWSSRLHDCGFHTNHFHSKGWISSAYYVSVPEIADDTASKQGWIKFGEPYFDAGLKNPIRRTVQPEPGTLVLFPSYMWHGTVPFRSEDARTTIAFDVVPK
jgi:tetratricopeptide (TPR) repeat protein